MICAPEMILSASLFLLIGAFLGVLLGSILRGEYERSKLTDSRKAND